MPVWVPWDADDDEVVDLHVVRERIPPSLRPALKAWLYNALVTEGTWTPESSVNALQSAVRIDLGLSRGYVSTEVLVDAIEGQGDQILLRVVDFLLSNYSYMVYSDEPANVAELRWHTDTSMAAISITVQDGEYRLARRLPEGVEEAAELSVRSTDRVAGQHLAKALHEAQSLTPDTSKVMTEAIRAVEAAAGSVVIPNEKSPRLSKIVAALKSKSGWKLALRQRDDAYPDHQAVLIGMMETLAFAQQDRHSGESPSVAEAQGHVLLAANLVGWFSTGVVQMGD